MFQITLMGVRNIYFQFGIVILFYHHSLYYVKKKNGI